MNDHIHFILLWLLNSISLYVLGAIFPSEITLGSLHLSYFEAAIYAGFWLTFFLWTLWEYLLVRKVGLEPFALRLFYFFFVNSLGIWIISQYGRFSGLGVASFGWVLILGGILDLLQGAFWNILGKRLRD